MAVGMVALGDQLGELDQATGTTNRTALTTTVATVDGTVQMAER